MGLGEQKRYNNCHSNSEHFAVIDFASLKKDINHTRTGWN